MDLIIQILHNLLSDYENTVEILKTELEKDDLPLEKVKEKLRAKFERINTPGSKVERALVTNDNSKRYKGNCTYCGIYGHRIGDCRKRMGNKKPENGRFEPPITCYICQKKGHKSYDCPNNSQNVRGQNYRANVS